MEFWGVEVKPGKSVKVPAEDGLVLHLSQASIGESKKNESAVLNLKVGDKKFVIGTLSHDKFPQTSFDLVFDEEFELSHNWKNGSVYFVGYKSIIPDEGDFSDEFDSDEEEAALFPLGQENGNVEEKPVKAQAKGKKAEPSKDDEDDSDEDDESDDSDAVEDESDSDEEMQDGESDDDESDDDSDEEEEETPKKAENGKKRPAESAVETPASKKAKATPEKTDGKKGGHSATPHPAKKDGKTPAKGQQQTPKSGGQFSCTPCKKSFSSDVGLQSHNKAKHSGK